jgi:hypothetical protein
MGYTHALPALTSIGGSADLRGYTHALPALTSIGGSADLRGYTHALPALTSIGGYADLRGYTHALPALTSIGGYADLSGYTHALPVAIAGGLPIPVVNKIDSAILAAIEHGGELNMSNWHKYQTTHCRAGWAVHLSGKPGYALEEKLGTALAGALIYQASRPGQPFPDFYTDNDAALADIKAGAAREAAA